jgi:hypothetical protein
MKLRSIFRGRRKRPPIYIDVATRAARKANPKPGTVNVAKVWHRHDCPRPRGGECICQPHELDVEISRSAYEQPTRRNPPDNDYARIEPTD